MDPVDHRRHGGNGLLMPGELWMRAERDPQGAFPARERTRIGYA